MEEDGVMQARTTARLAWFTWILAVLFQVALILVTSASGKPTSTTDLALSLGFVSLQLAFSTIGALVASRRPENVIGWLFCVAGLALSVVGASEGYTELALTKPDSLPLAQTSAWVATWAGGAPILGPLIFLFLLFPDGRLSSRRWLPVAWIAIGAMALSLFVAAFTPGPLQSAPEVPNPFGIQALRGLLEALFTPIFLIVLGTLFASVACMILRLRRARGQERQQLKWVASAAAILGVAFVVGPIVWAIPGIPDVVWEVVFVMAVGTLPVSAGIAILRYRLYDIDLIINRTLVYGELTAVLALIYLAGVVGVGGLVRQATGQERNSLVVAASTLAVAGLFRPARTRIQAFIDRRFYRSKYDAQQTIADFSVRMRGQIDLDSLTSEMAAVVQNTVQPTHISLWLRS